ncbi:lactate utilization protein [Alkaliphilus pronyensis]|uniref:Lactate utilization protein n=1 Tax=Alkaliphilus pronyensis TaxID=1482732 RepID=A0A6I0F829_9FIRM|nr:lactate utilization protein [Alkaliphilus pronyensis]KAB3534476.1 lactate utilization protein [Alkaliphilus pronyensis]
MSKINTILRNLEKKGIQFSYYETAEDAKQAILKEIQPDNVVGIGGSMTINSLKLYEELKRAGNTVYWHWKVDASEANEVRRKASTADVYLTSTNALTEEGELINIDGVGNRVAAMFYGPKKVIVVCGINKISTDLISAIDRIKARSCPPNAKRLGLKTPCAETDICNDCLSKDRMCNVTTIINHKPMTVDLKVIIIGEELGY